VVVDDGLHVTSQRAWLACRNAGFADALALLLMHTQARMQPRWRCRFLLSRRFANARQECSLLGGCIDFASTCFNTYENGDCHIDIYHSQTRRAIFSIGTAIDYSL
jgi:hypothetical protein